MIYNARHELHSEPIHLSVMISCLIAPTIAFSVHGYVLKRCGLEIQTDFITKNEDPCQDCSRPQNIASCKLGVEEKWKPCDEDYLAARDEIGDSNDYSIN